MLYNSSYQMVYDKLNYLVVAVPLIQVVLSPVVVLQQYFHLDLIKLYRLCVGCEELLLYLNFIIIFFFQFNIIYFYYPLILISLCAWSPPNVISFVHSKLRLYRKVCRILSDLLLPFLVMYLVKLDFESMGQCLLLFQVVG